MKQTESKTSFNNGEVSPSFYSRFDHEKYASGVKRMENFLPLQMGGAFYRPGTRYVASTKDPNQHIRLIPFIFSSAIAYVIEMGHEYMRFFTERAQVVVNPSAPIDTYTKVLSHFDGTDGDRSYTAETEQVFSFFGDAQIDTSQHAFSTGASLQCFAAGSSYVSLPASTDFDLGAAASGDFTIEGFFTFQSISNQPLFGCFNGGASGWAVTYNNSLGSLRIFNAANAYNVAWVPVAGTRYHIAIKRATATITVYINAVSIGTITDDTWQSSGDLTIGYVTGYGAYFDGWIEEFRLSKGIARTVSVPTTPYGGADPWLTATAYVVGDYVSEGGTSYLCLIAHTSGTFATDLAAGKWTAQTELEIVTPYAQGDLHEVQYAQKADVMYIFHPDKHPQKLTRASATEFTIADAPFIRGPFLDTNITAITMTASADTGTGITLTASSASFLEGHVGSLWRIKSGVVKITAFTSTTVVTANVQAEPSGTAGNLATGPGATADWAEGAFSDVRGYPASGTFFGQRLIMGGTSHQPQRFYASYLGAYDNFKTDASDASAAWIYEISSDLQNAIRWIAPTPESIQFGSVGGTTSADVLSGTITNVNPPRLKPDTNFGTLPIQPRRVSSNLYYIQKNGFNLRELSYNFVSQRNFSEDMNLYADHILRDGLGAHELEYQQSPEDRLWIVRNDGQMAVFLRNATQQIMGWARVLSGMDLSGSPGFFESAAVIQRDEGDDEVWVIVKRTVGGATVRYIEYFTPERPADDFDKVLLDSSLTLDSPITITGATKANPVVITAPSHGFSNGDQVKIDNVVGMTDLNGNSYLIANITTNTFELQTVLSVNVNGTAYGTYVSGGEVREMVTAISGLSHLEGETVYVQTDGDIPTTESYTVSGGAITLSTKAAVVHVGLKYTGTLQMLKLSGPTKLGTGQGKHKRIYKATYRVEKSKRFKVGQDEDRLLTVAMPDSAGTGTYTGDVEKVFQNNWSKEAEPVIVQDKPLALTVSAILFHTESEEIT